MTKPTNVVQLRNETPAALTTDDEVKAEWARVAPAMFGAYHDHGYRDAMGGAVGKVPKDFDENGRPGPLTWNKPHPKARLKRAANAGANIFIRNERDPSLDFDCKTAPVADELENVGANLAKRKGHKAPLTVRYRDNSPSSRAAQVALEDGAAPLDGWKITATEENALAALGRPPQKNDFKPGGALYGATHAFEFRGAGQLTVMEGIHPSGARLKTRGPHPATVGRDQLLRVNAADSDWLKVEIAAAFERAGCRVIGGLPPPETPGPTVRPARSACTAHEWVNQVALENVGKWAPAAFPEGGAPSPDAWRVPPEGLGRTCEEALSINPAGIRDFGQEWGEKKGYTPTDLIAKFCTIAADGEIELAGFDEDDAPLGNMPTETAARWLCSLLSLDWDAMREEDIARDFADPIPAGADIAAAEPIGSISISPFVLGDPSEIEPRSWLYGYHYIRKFLSMTVAPGGLGKSSLVLAEALAMATGRNLLGEQPLGKINVLYFGGEDPLDETVRRLTAACVHYRISPDEISGRLFVNSGRDSAIIIASEDRNGLNLSKSTVAALLRAIRENKIDLVIFDPFVAFHAVSENDNTKVAAVCRQLAMIADETGCAIEAVHHTKKPGAGQSEVSANDARGASAAIAAARSARALNAMTKDEAAKAGIETPRSFFRVDNCKANMAPPADRSTWRRLVSVSLGNGRGAIRGDSVGVVTAWTWPDPSQAITPDDIQAVQEAIAAGEWRESTQASNWAGKAIASVLRLDLADLSAKSAVRVLLRKWIDDGILKIVRRRDASRKEHAFVEVGNGGAEW
jgi:hypothetical protein